jgi:hypothetical protein
MGKRFRKAEGRPLSPARELRKWLVRAVVYAFAGAFVLTGALPGWERVVVLVGTALAFWFCIGMAIRASYRTYRHIRHRGKSEKLLKDDEHEPPSTPPPLVNAS